MVRRTSGGGPLRVIQRLRLTPMKESDVLPYNILLEPEAFDERKFQNRKLHTAILRSLPWALIRVVSRVGKKSPSEAFTRELETAKVAKIDAGALREDVAYYGSICLPPAALKSLEEIVRTAPVKHLKDKNLIADGFRK